MIKHPYKSGQMLVVLLVFIIVGVAITTTAVSLVISGNIKASKFQEGLITYNMAESGIENALIRYLRDAAYTGETLTIGTGTVTITITGTTTKTITADAKNGSYQRKIQAIVTDSGGVMTITSWQEIF